MYVTTTTGNMAVNVAGNRMDCVGLAWTRNASGAVIDAATGTFDIKSRNALTLNADTVTIEEGDAGTFPACGPKASVPIDRTTADTVSNGSPIPPVVQSTTGVPPNPVTENLPVASNANVSTSNGTWIYEQSTGNMFFNNTIVGTGYSGNTSGVNNPSEQDVQFIGPIPEGYYTFGSPQTPISILGPYALPLTPNAGNMMYGRAGFFIHGDTPQHNFSASEGCIIMPLSVRQMMASSGQNNLQVVANASTLPPSTPDT
jgi:hypothetical protein